MEVWVTKYALTRGIEKLDVIDCGDGMVKTAGNFSNGGGQYFHGEGKDWHRQEWQAKVHADFMRKKKIETLKKSIAKLEKVVF